MNYITVTGLKADRSAMDNGGPEKPGWQWQISRIGDLIREMHAVFDSTSPHLRASLPFRNELGPRDRASRECSTVLCTNVFATIAAAAADGARPSLRGVLAPISTGHRSCTWRRRSLRTCDHPQLLVTSPPGGSMPCPGVMGESAARRRAEEARDNRDRERERR
ncbi:hypothetical protein BJV78DRAFT_737824 [Lactifluus subvellereus]|nr:hypothetical protein BJV78DRAFT_737824 [Lactifluus subvellereus]